MRSDTPDRAVMTIQSVFGGNSERGIYISGVKTMFARDIGIDLGTASVLVYKIGRAHV